MLTIFLVLLFLSMKILVCATPALFSHILICIFIIIQPSIQMTAFIIYSSGILHRIIFSVTLQSIYNSTYKMFSLYLFYIDLLKDNTQSFQWKFFLLQIFFSVYFLYDLQVQIHSLSNLLLPIHVNSCMDFIQSHSSTHVLTNTKICVCQVWPDPKHLCT